MRKLKLFLALILALFFPFLACATPLNQPLTIILDWLPNPDHGPLFVAEQQGFFKKAGLNIKIIGPANPADAPKLVSTGKADIAIMYQPQLMLAIANGLPLIRIATLIGSPLNCMAIYPNKSVKTMADLKGKTVAYSIDGLDEAILNVMLAKAHLSIPDIHLINVNYNLMQALLSHRVDAAIGLMRNVELVQLHRMGLQPLVFYPEENGIPAYEELILVVNKSQLNDQRLPAFLHALQQGHDYLQAYPEQSWELFAQNHPELNNAFNREVWFKTLPYFAKYPAHMNQKRYQKFARFMEEQKLIKQALPVSTYAVELQVH